MLTLLNPSLNWLLLFVPVCLVLRYWPAIHSDVGLFICSALAIIPLAGLMGRPLTGPKTPGLIPDSPCSPPKPRVRMPVVLEA